MRRSLGPLLLCASIEVALAQPAPPPSPPVPVSQAQRLRANAFLAEGDRQLAAGNIEAALGLFEAAYRELPDSQILVNIAIIQRRLGRLLDAAATCERFFADPARSAAKVARMTRELTELDAQLARLEVVVVAPTGSTVEVQLDDGRWQPSPDRPVRVMPGAHQVRARGGAGTVPVEVAVDAAAGALVPVRLDLTPPPVVETPPPIEAPPVVETPPAIEAPPRVETPPIAPRVGRFGATVAAAIDPQSGGVAGKVTLGYAATARLAVEVGGMLGGNNAVHAAATVALTTGRLRPILSAGGTIAFYRWSGEMGLLGERSRTLVGLHGAVGGEYWLTARFAAIASAAVEYYPTGEPDIHPVAITPTVGVRGRL